MTICSMVPRGLHVLLLDQALPEVAAKPLEPLSL